MPLVIVVIDNDTLIRRAGCQPSRTRGFTKKVICHYLDTTRLVSGNETGHTGGRKSILFADPEHTGRHRYLVSFRLPPSFSLVLGAGTRATTTRVQVPKGCKGEATVRVFTGVNDKSR